MTRDEIIKLAREARWGTVVSMPHVDALERFAALVAAAEREECAKLCEEQAIRSEASMRKSKTVKAREIYSSAGQTAHWMVAAIRARGQA